MEWKEQVDAARSANLAEYFQNNGYECELRKNELHVKGYGGLFVNLETGGWYCFSENKGGSNAVNCLTDIIGIDFKTAVQELSGSAISYTPRQEKNSFSTQKKEFVQNSRENSFSAQKKELVPNSRENSFSTQKKGLALPERAENMRKVFAYLCKTRGISADIVSQLAHDRLLYQDVRGNAVFVHKNEGGEIVGAEIQGTNSEKRFKGVAEGTRDSVFAIKIGEPKKCYVFESAIDLMSFKQIANQDKIQNSLLVSMAGLKPNSLKSIAESGMKIYSCVDNDEAGHEFEIANGLPSCRKVLVDNGVKDYNELLKKVTCPQEVQKNLAQKNEGENASLKNSATKKSSHGRR